jgi:diguanylate cyclase (GGDEF)-like protein
MRAGRPGILRIVPGAADGQLLGHHGRNAQFPATRADGGGVRAAPAVTVDASLRRRRRTVEACALGARGIGLASTLAVALGLVPQGSVSFSPILLQSCWAGIVIMAVAGGLSALAFRHPESRHYAALGAAQVLLDSSLIIGIVILFALDSERTTWPLLAVPIVVAAIRFRLTGALIAWAVTSGSFAAVILYLGDRAVRPEDLSFAVSIHLLVALVTGTQASAFHRQLAHLQETRAALLHQAGHDGLTGLPNRARLAEHFGSLADGPVAVMVMDLDGFKPINDTFGHAVGDRVLRVVAERLNRVLGPGNVAGRLGGDEFLILLPDVGADAAARVERRIHEATGEPIDVGGRHVRVGASLGTVFRPYGRSDDLESLTARADAMMYAAKNRRKTGAHVLR